MTHAETEQNPAEHLPIEPSELMHDLNLDREIFQEDEEGVKVSTILLVALSVPVAVYVLYLLQGLVVH